MSSRGYTIIICGLLLKGIKFWRQNWSQLSSCLVLYVLYQEIIRLSSDYPRYVLSMFSDYTRYVLSMFSDILGILSVYSQYVRSILSDYTRYILSKFAVYSQIILGIISVCSQYILRLSSVIRRILSVCSQLVFTVSNKDIIVFSVYYQYVSSWCSQLLSCVIHFKLYCIKWILYRLRMFSSWLE